MPDNPFSISFGREPGSAVSRMAQTSVIEESFSAQNPPVMAYMLTGVRGSGKTVLLTELSNRFRKQKDWIVIDLNPERDLLQSLGAALCNQAGLASVFQKAKLNLSLFGLGIEVDGIPPITDPEIAIDRMLEQVDKKKKKVLVTIDEVTSNAHMKVFAASYQIFIRHHLPLFALMAGLYENIDHLQNEKSLTFLHRTPKVKLEPLNTGAMADRYEELLRIDREKALEMARLTKGYPFAFQTLGYYCYREKALYTQILPKVRQALEEYVYRKIWSELSANDKRLVVAISESESGRVKEVREIAHMKGNEFTPYRERLIRKGIIQSEQYGYISFTLPFFDVFVKENSR